MDQSGKLVVSFFLFLYFISLIADGPQRCHRVNKVPVVTKDLLISPRFRIFIAMQVQHSYNSSTNG